MFALASPAIAASTKRDKIAFRTDIRQAHGGHKFRKLAREERIATAAANDLHDCVTAFPRNLDVGLVGRIQRLGDGGHQLLDQEPAAGLECSDHPHQRRLPFGNECQDCPGVDDVEGTFGQRIDADVVATQLDVGRQRSGHPVDVDVGRHYLAG